VSTMYLNGIESYSLALGKNLYWDSLYGASHVKAVACLKLTRLMDRIKK
jgi:hypothetical protein